MTQEDDAQHGHEIVAGGELGVGPEIIGCFPKISFKFGEIFHVEIELAPGPPAPVEAPRLAGAAAGVGCT